MKKSLAFTLLILLITLTPLQTKANEQEPIAPEPRVQVITKPQWISGQVAVHLFNYPIDGATLQTKTITLQIAVWGVEKTRPVTIQLDGEKVATITEPGYYQYQWNLLGSHHLVIRDQYKIFQTSGFNIKNPPPPPITIPITEFNQKLETQFNQVLTLAITAATLGVPSGIWIKKKTKIMTEWALTPPAILAVIGVNKLPTHYMLIPYAAVTMLTYTLSPPYATKQAILVATKGMVDTRVLTLDEQGYAIQDIGPRHIKTGFIQKKKVNLIENNHPIDFKYPGVNLRCVTVNSPENIKETPTEITIKCSPTLAQALTKQKAIKKLEDQVAENNFKLIFMEQALSSIITETILEMERTLEDLKLDQTTTIPQAQERVEQATEQMKQLLQQQTQHTQEQTQHE